MRWLFSLIIQVLKAKVLHCDPDKAKMVLSFKAVAEGDTEEPALPQLDCEVGKMICVSVLLLLTLHQSLLNFDFNMCHVEAGS